MVRSIDHFDTGTREDIPMFDQACFDEALKNAFIHNNWLRRVAPMTTFYEDRIEITSFSSLAPNQTTEGFYKGRSVPVNEELSSIFLATHLSERTGRGNPLIVSRLGKEAFQIEESSITVTIPYNWQHRFENVIENPIDKVIDNLSVNERNVLLILQKNPKATHGEIGRQIGLGPTSVYKIIASLRKKGILVREGSNKKGNWKIRASDK